MSDSKNMSGLRPITELAVVGAGTMGSGIALAALYAGCRVRLYDVSAEVLEKAVEYIDEYLRQKDHADKRANLTTHSSLEELAPAELWVEAVPEDINLKQDIFRQMEQLADPAAILATNTSTLPVSSIAAVLEQPGRALGLHFFNPAAVMPLVEVVNTDQTKPEVLQRGLDFVDSLGKTGIQTRDTPGFIVNRVARPFYGEALMLLAEGLASIQQIDQLVEGLGFPMGPFRLMDFIGNDVNLAATRSVFEQSFMEPRYRPSVIQQRLVQAGKLGRKSGQGFYRYPLPEEAVAADEVVTGGELKVYLAAEDFAPGLRALLAQSQIELLEEPAEAGIIIVAAANAAEMVAQLDQLQQQAAEKSVLLGQTVTMSLSELQRGWPWPDRAIGFDSLLVAQSEAIELVAGETRSEEARQTISKFLRQIDRQPVWVTDGPGLVLPRILAMLINEAAFAAQEGVAPAEKIDLAMRLGVRYPQGPLAWGKLLGFERIFRVLQDLSERHGDPRYRTALALRRWAFGERQ